MANYTICTPLLRAKGIVDQTEFTPEEFEKYREKYEQLWAEENGLPAPSVVKPTKKRKA